MNDEPPDIVDWGFDEPTKKEMASDIYKQLINDDELMYELNVLLRKNKINKIEDNENQ